MVDGGKVLGAESKKRGKVLYSSFVSRTRGNIPYDNYLKQKTSLDVLFTFFKICNLFFFCSSVLYYTIRDEKSDESIGIRRISLRDVMVPSEELHLNVTRFRKVTFDAEAQAFYWIRQGMDSEEGDVIEKYWISNSSTMVVASRASNVEGTSVWQELAG